MQDQLVDPIKTLGHNMFSCGHKWFQQLLILCVDGREMIGAAKEWFGRENRAVFGICYLIFSIFLYLFICI